MITTHSSPKATLPPEEVVEALPPWPGLIVTEVPPDPALVLPLSAPAPTPTELEEEAEPAEACAREPRPLSALALSLRVRQGCSLSMMIVVPPLLPLTIETSAPMPEVEVTESAAASVADPARKRVESTISARMVDPSR
jgi:hypothetical protein